MSSGDTDADWQGTTQAQLDRAARARRWLRYLLPALAAAFTAVMCAGPLALAAPGTMAWFEGLACPGSQHLEVLEVMDISVTPAETRQVVYCVDAEGQGTLAGVRPFAVMWAAYFGMFLGLAFGGAAIAGQFGRWFFGRPKRPLGWDAEREARALVAQGKQAEAVALVRAKTGAGPRWARRYVEVLAGEAGNPRHPPTSTAPGPSADEARR